MITSLFEHLHHYFPKMRGIFWRNIYDNLAKSYQKENWTFMNYGYVPIDEKTGDFLPLEKIHLDRSINGNPCSIQLYHHIANAIPLDNLEVLEVGCGRGGGARYIKNNFNPKHMVGLDFSEHAIQFCKRVHQVEGLTFKTGNAEDLPFENDSFDALINLESSHCYTSMENFLLEVKRVVRKDGYLLYADFRNVDEILHIENLFKTMGFTVCSKFDITPNVLRSLDINHDEKAAWNSKIAPKFIQPALSEFSALKGSKLYNSFLHGETLYKRFLLQNTDES